MSINSDIVTTTLRMRLICINVFPVQQRKYMFTSVKYYLPSVELLTGPVADWLFWLDWSTHWFDWLDCLSELTDWLTCQLIID